MTLFYLWKIMSLFNNKYRIESTRLPFYDYSMPGYYFVTVCVQGGHYYFGQVENKKMKLSKLGRAVGKYWQEIPKHFPFVKLDEFMVMPNHIHGIIIIMKKTQHVETQDAKTQHVETQDAKTQHVETQNLASLRQKRQKRVAFLPYCCAGHHHKFGPQSRNLGSIVRGFKIGVTKYAHRQNIEFFWQARFYEHIIKTDEALRNIRGYIKNNPLNCARDRNKLD